MSSPLQQIRDFGTLLSHLSAHLGWPVDLNDFQPDDYTYDYTPDELGIDPKYAVKVQQIRQLRPLTNGQPWGVFYVEFEAKTLPITVLRRVLRAFVRRKRASANPTDRQVWNLGDLLFISAAGRQGRREITFAHFRDNGQGLPQLRTFGWDESETKFDNELNKLNRLKWPKSPTPEAWKQWAEAFPTTHRYAVGTAKELSKAMAQLAKATKAEVLEVYKYESEEGSLHKLYKSFREALIHDLNEDGFADMLAQTLAYGLFSIRAEGAPNISLANLSELGKTDPFLQELLGELVRLAGLEEGQIDFDELHVSDLVEMLNQADMREVLADFGRTGHSGADDPVIHFYENFLKEYDKAQKVKRGVFYTPKPVVSYIVRSVHELLQTEFGLEDGLADTATWGEMLQKHPDLKLPPLTDELGEKRTISPDEPFVRILDPATGTATFLVEVIDVIYRTLRENWDRQRLTKEQQQQAWNDYVPKHLLPRLYGYELMMAPYAIAHLKIGLKLIETGYDFATKERARVYLTNSLEPWQRQIRLPRFEALAHEAEAVNEVKRDTRFVVIIGNPPYSGHSWNLTPELRKMVEPYRFVNGIRIKEKGALQLEKSIQDDYVKFYRLGQEYIDRSGIGVIGLVTSHGFLDNPFLRGMRSSVVNSFTHLFFLDLHGNVLRHEKSPDGSPDKNVFDIKRTGTAISILRKLGNNRVSQIRHADLWGDRDNIKYPWLMQSTVQTTETRVITLQTQDYLLVPQNLDALPEYPMGYSIADAMPVYSKGVVTGRDAFVIDFDENALLERMETFVDGEKSEAELIEEYDLNPTPWWEVDKARRAMPSIEEFKKFVRPILYRPFDIRVCFYHPSVFMSPRRPVIRNVDPGRKNLLLITSRMTKGEKFAHVTIADGLAEAILLSSKTSNNAMIFPLYLYPEAGNSLGMLSNRQPNFSHSFNKALQKTTQMSVVDGRGDFESSIGAEDILGYLVSILHSISFRKRYTEPLARNFPRIPLTSDIKLFYALSRLGHRLIALHLLKSPEVDQFITTFVDKNREVTKVGEKNKTLAEVKDGKGRVYINGNSYFDGVPQSTWEFHVGGYQVLHKWLSDRKGRTLSDEEIAHYQKVVIALTETQRIMQEIDAVIEEHGGWPLVGSVSAENAPEQSAKPDGALFAPESPLYE